LRVLTCLSSAVCLLAILTPLRANAQESLPNQSTGIDDAAHASGVVTGEKAKAFYDAENRPITAGGFVDKGPVVFQNVAKQAGLTVWHHTMGTPQKRHIIETNGSGVALLDYDNDGWLDIYLVSGSTYEAEQGKAPAPHAALFHNNHDGTFTDVAAKAGVTNDRWGFGVAIGDYDNDGWPDMYVTNFGKNRLYHNNHDGTFTDVAEKAGVTLGNWSTGATFGDYDGDGRLDLFVPGYVHYDMQHEPEAGGEKLPNSFCSFRGVSTMCGPHGLHGEPDHLFHNNGDGTFTDVSEQAGVADKSRYYGFTSIFADMNGDGKPDIMVADDSTPNYLYLNKGNGTFDDVSYQSGYALNANGRETASMGIAIGDYRNNGRLDLLNTTFSDDYDVLYQNDGDANLNDVSFDAGIADITVPFLGWGTAFMDYDNDGWKDIFVANGHVYPVADQQRWGTSFAERPLLFRNLKGSKFDLVPAVQGTGLAEVVPSRGAAFGDLFNDGKIDVVINSMDHAPVLLRNVNDDHHHWVAFKLIGGPKSPRDAVGAVVYLTANGMRQRGDVLSGGSYESSNDFRVHFGLGDATTIDGAEIHWPGGAVEKLNVPSFDRILTVEEGKGITGELCTLCKSSTNRMQADLR
jgi:hypothetical protein